MTEGGHDHSMTEGGHDHFETIDLSGVGALPALELVAASDGPGAIALKASVSGMDLVPVETQREHQPGEGHLHVVVNGLSVAMIAEENYRITGLTNGSHVVDVTLSSNDHRTYVVDGKPIGSTATVVVERGGEEEPDRRFNVELAGGRVVGGAPRFEVSIGARVEISVTADLVDEVHLHVYDVTAKVGHGSPAVLPVVASIPGIFEAELHTGGIVVFELQVS